MFHQQEVCGAGQDKVASSAVGVDGAFDCQQYLGGSLDFIKNDGAGGEQRIRIARGLVENAQVIEGEVGARRSDRLCERGFPGLPCAGQDSDGHDSEGRL
jgi:hypothetical protein